MTIFTKIIQGQIPSYKIFEDDLTYAFLDINPTQSGHTLIVPKEAVATFTDLSDDLRNHIFKVAKKISLAIQIATGSKRVGLQVHGLGVPDHFFHLHLIPINNSDDMDTTKTHTESPEEMQKIKDKIVSNLG